MLTYSHLSSSKISEKSLMWVLRTRWLRFSAQFRIKMSHDWTKNILWKYSRLLPFLTSISLTLYRISKNLYSRFCKKGMFWAPFGVKTVHVWEETFFLNIHHGHLSFFLYHLKDFKKILYCEFHKKGVERFEPNLGYKCPTLVPKEVFSEYSLQSSLLTYSGQLLHWVSKKSFKWIPRIRYTSFWVQFGVKTSHFWSKMSFIKK